MGNCAKSNTNEENACVQLLLKGKANQTNKSGQLYNFKKGLETDQKKKNLSWDQLFSNKTLKTHTDSHNTTSDKKPPNQFHIAQTPANAHIRAKLFQKQNAFGQNQQSSLPNSLTAKQLNYQLTKENFQRCYQNGIGFDNQSQQLPRPQGKIIKKKKYQPKQQATSPAQTKNKEKAVLTMIEPEIIPKTTQSVENQEASIVECLQNEEKFQGMYVQGQQSSRIQLRISSSNIEFILPKARAGPLIVSQIDYMNYSV